ncbi:MAG: PQQ-binding-like beta-propeller repeat protein [Vicinamibacterales bacterium]
MTHTRMSLVQATFFALAATGAFAQQPSPGQRVFDARCASCHGGDARGGPMGPGIAALVSAYSDAQLATLVRTGLAAGMPAATISDEDMAALATFLRTIQTPNPAAGQPQAPARAGGPAPGAGAARGGGPAAAAGGGGRGRPVVRGVSTLVDGRALDGVITDEGLIDRQVRTDDGRVHLLRRQGDRYREVTSSVDWVTYHGDASGNRYTPLTQITKANVSRLAPRWTFSVPGATRLQGTPIVAGGIMYVTNINECFALDAGTGRQIWRWQRATTPGTVGASSNRGVGVHGDRVVLVTDNAHLVALNRFTGQPVWETEMADFRQNYFATGAPLVVGDLIVSGVGGGEHGVRGFVAAYDAATGKEAWRFWTIPGRGEPGSETWQGPDIDHGGGPTWMTGTYDAELGLLYWPVGNPGKEYDGSGRVGDNLYTDSILALDVKTGTLKWHFQFTPHDVWDWDAAEPPVLVNTNWEGRPRKLLLHADRNGFFYVFDRTNGALLLGKPFVQTITWATGLDGKGRPIVVAGQEPSAAGTRVCPSQEGATNFYSTSFNPATGLYYLHAFERCGIYTLRDSGPWAPGASYLGGNHRASPSGKTEHFLRALDIHSGKTVWELPQPGNNSAWGGVLSTATGLVFFGDEGGALAAADATTGRLLWTFHTNQLIKGSPITYMFDGKQYIANIAGGLVVAVALPD